MELMGLSRAEYKVPGGKLIRVRVEAEANRIKGIKFTGDFFLHPETDLEELERLLIGVEAKAVREAISKFFEERGTILIGVSPGDFVKVVLKALRA